MANARSAALAVFTRTLRAPLRRPVVLTFSLLQPLLWMAFFGPLFQRVVLPAALHGIDYVSFVAPGVSLLAVLLGASQSGISLVRDAQTGMLARMLHTKASSAVLLAGKLAADVLRLLVQALAVLGLGMLLGASLSFHAEHALFALGAVVLFAWSLASISCAIAALSRAPEVMGAYVHLINMPLLFTSSALVPGKQLPSFLQPVARLNPLSVAARGFRALFLGHGALSLEELCALAVLAIVCFACAALALLRARTNE